MPIKIIQCIPHTEHLSWLSQHRKWLHNNLILQNVCNIYLNKILNTHTNIQNPKMWMMFQRNDVSHHLFFIYMYFFTPDVSGYKKNPQNIINKQSAWCAPYPQVHVVCTSIRLQSEQNPSKIHHRPLWNLFNTY